LVTTEAPVWRGVWYLMAFISTSLTRGQGESLPLFRPLDSGDTLNEPRSAIVSD